MRKKTQKEIIHEYLLARPSSTKREIASGTGIKQGSVHIALHSLIAEGAVRVSGETVGRGGVTNCYEVKLGTGPQSNRDAVYNVLLNCDQAVTLLEISKLTGLSPKAAGSTIWSLRKAGKVELGSRERINRALVCTYRAVKQAEQAEEAGCEDILKRIVALGGGPFGLMAAQLGATAR